MTSNNTTAPARPVSIFRNVRWNDRYKVFRFVVGGRQICQGKTDDEILIKASALGHTLRLRSADPKSSLHPEPPRPAGSILPPGVSWNSSKGMYLIRRTYNGEQKTYGSRRKYEDILALMDELGFCGVESERPRSQAQYFLTETCGLAPRDARWVADGMRAVDYYIVSTSLSAKQKAWLNRVGLTEEDFKKVLSIAALDNRDPEG